MIKRGKAEKWAARSERLSAALRQNLKRRKEQARGRADGDRAAQEVQAPEIRAPEMQAPEMQKQRGEANLPPPDTATGAAAPDFRRNPGRNSPTGAADGNKAGAGG